MNAKVDAAVGNGIDHTHQEQAERPPEPSPLQQAIQRHGAALIALNTIQGPRGASQVAVDPRQMMIDIELATVRLEVLFLALIKAGAIDGNVLTELLTNKLNDEALQMEVRREREQGPQIQVAPASLLKRP